MPLVATRGAASAQGFGEFAQSAAPVPTYIEDVFSTWLYTGNNGTQTITNGIDLSTKGGLVWTKSRDDGSLYHVLSDSATGPNNVLRSNSSAAAFTYTSVGWSVPVFNTSGYTTSDSGYVSQNAGGLNKFVSWTFRKQPKFFDVVTYTGDGNYSTDTPAPYGRAIAHSLTSRPGFIVIKATSTTSDWYVGARQNDTYWFGSFGTGTSAFRLNGTGGATQYDWATKPMADSTNFYPAFIGAGGSSGTTNDNGVTYVAYLFAHNAGGFGLTGTDNVITCGSFTTDGSANATVNLGYEPQWVLIKPTSRVDDWKILDNMRGWTDAVDGDQLLIPNRLNAEQATNLGNITSTGFTFSNAPNETSIYIAIRRGPMKTPTTGTSVFSPVALSSPGGTPNTLLRTTGFPVDFYFEAVRNTSFAKFGVGSRLQGQDAYMFTYIANQETWAGDLVNNFWDNNTGISITDNNGSWNGNAGGQTTIMEALRRAPGFCDVVCYTGTGSVSTVNHNLGVVPELMIVKARSSAIDWVVGAQSLGINSVLVVNTNGAIIPVGNYWGTSWPTSTAITYSGNGYSGNNSAGVTYVAYLFASCPGVSKVGSYTGTGALQTINCGFAGGARFVLIKRSDSTGDWYVYDSARGITSGDDPYLLLNSGAAEVTNTNYVGTTSVGFQVTAAAPADLNASGGNYIFLAIA